ncbi:MAG: hypothetical protein RMN53_14770 [Anaerolineae bacterium]|nr:hypothetical protein [Anaerolineae bacterium]
MTPPTFPTAEPTPPSSKRAYRSPRLTVYGTVRSLTAAARGTFPETRRRSEDPTRLRLF